MTLKDIFLSSTGTSNLEVNSKEKLSQLLCSIIMNGDNGDDESIELAFRLALDHLSAKKVSDWQWIILNRVLCQTTYQPVRHKNLLRNLKYKLLLGSEGS